jgi:hypothetical protein
MAKAKAKHTRKPPAERKLAILSKKFDALAKDYRVAEELKNDAYRKVGRERERRLALRTDLKEGTNEWYRVNDEIDQESRTKYGADGAWDGYIKFNNQLHDLSEKIIAKKATSYEDLAIQVKAYSFLSYDAIENMNDEKKNFMLRFANFLGVKLIIHTPD